LDSDTIPVSVLYYKPKGYRGHSEHGYESWKRLEFNPRKEEVKNTKNKQSPLPITPMSPEHGGEKNKSQCPCE
jgi:hypothetical protein